MADDSDRSTELLALVSRSYPHPVARAARSLKVASSVHERLDEALRLGDALITTLGAIGLGWCNAYAPREQRGVKDWHRSFVASNVTLGLWMAAARDGAAAALQNGQSLAGMEVALGTENGPLRRELAVLVELHNDVTHGRRSSQDALDEYELHLLPALELAGFLARMKLIAALSIEGQRGSERFRVRYRDMTGSEPLFEVKSLESPSAFLADMPYLLYEDAAELELAPYLAVAHCPRCTVPEVHYLNKRTRRGFKYTSFTTGHWFQTAELTPELPTWDGYRHGYRVVSTPDVLVAPTLNPQPLSSDRIDLPDLYRRTQASLLLALREDERTGAKGWSHHLELSPVTPVATAFGAHIMHLVADDFSLYRPKEILDSLWNMRLEHGGWTSKSQFPTARPEATAFVLMAMCVWGDWDRAGQALERFEEILQPGYDDTLWRHIYSLTVAIPALASLAPRSALLAKLIEVLEDAAVVDGRTGGTYWTRFTRMDSGFDPATPSVPLTARTALALDHCFQVTNRALGWPRDRLRPVLDWLASEPEWPNEIEEINRDVDAYRPDKLMVWHFTDALAARALLELDHDPTDARIRSVISRIYGSHSAGLWDWHGSDGRTVNRPIWATLDALRALTAHALRTSPYLPGPPAGNSAAR